MGLFGQILLIPRRSLGNLVFLPVLKSRECVNIQRENSEKEIVKAFLTILFFLGIFGLIRPESAHAGLMLDVDASNFQDSTTTSASVSETKSFYGAGVYVDVDSKSEYYLGATFANIATVDSLTAGTTSFGSQDIILGFRWVVDKSRTFMLSAGYGISSQGSYKAAASASTETISGTSTYFKLTAAPEIKGRWNVGLSLIYYQSTYNQSIVSNTKSDVSYNKTLLFPSLGIAYHW